MHGPTSEMMNKSRLIGFVFLLVWNQSVIAQDLLTCGWDEVNALRISGTNTTTLWTWTAAHSNLPEWIQPRFATTDECKPCPDGKVLVTSSGGTSLNGAVALVDPETSNALFYARAANAHSADLLPSNRVVVALSSQTNGNRLVVYDLSRSDVELFSVELPGGHGVVWDDQRQVLWAFGGNEIREYELQNWESNPRLKKVSSTVLPEWGGHDMYPMPNSPNLLVSSSLHCWLFNRDTRSIAKHPIMGDFSNIKSISVHPVTRQIVYVKSESSWWAENLRFLKPEQTLHFPGARFYKARWIAPPRLVIKTKDADKVQVSWPPVITKFNLRETTNLEHATWAESADPVVNDGTNNFIMVNPTNGAHMFWMLQSES